MKTAALSRVSTVLNGASAAVPVGRAPASAVVASAPSVAASSPDASVSTAGFGGTLTTFLAQILGQQGDGGPSPSPPSTAASAYAAIPRPAASDGIDVLMPLSSAEAGAMTPAGPSLDLMV